MRDNRERLLDILESIGRVKRYSIRGREVFESDELVQVWIVHHLQNLGEAASALDSEIQEMAPEVPWAKITGMRNILVHEYFGIDLDLVWKVVEKDLPILESQIRSILEKLTPE